MLFWQSSASVLFVFTLALSAGHVDNAVVPELWISDLFYRVLANFTVRNVGSTACQKQSETYDNHLRNHTDWAVRMSESWNRYPNGILSGNRYHFGMYDECIDVNTPVKGQYCLSEIKLIPSARNNVGDDGKHNNTANFGANHAWHTILEWVDSPIQVARNILNLGICIPDSCTSSDLHTALQNEFDKVFLPEQVEAIVQVDPILCTVKTDTYPLNTAYYVTSVFFVILVLICLGATICQYVTMECKKKNAKIYDISNPWLNSFSFIESSKELFKFDKDNELNALNCSKALTMLAILFGHRYMYLGGNPMSNAELAEKLYTDGPEILLTSMNLVDPFFFISGFLIYITITPVFKKSGSIWMKLASPIVYRIFRMLPAYCAMMAITAHIVPHLGNGPLWSQKTWGEADKCKNYWWTNLLFINNFMDAKNQCLIVSWYISCDIQLFIVGIIVLYVYVNNNRYGVGLLGTLISASLIVPFVMTFLTKGDGLLQVNFPFLENPRSSVTFDKLYRPSYMRATPFFIGLAIGIIIDKLKEINFKLSKINFYAGTVVVVVVSMWIQFYGAKFYKKEYSYNSLEEALYATLSHCTWPLINSWFTICNFTTDYGLIKHISRIRLIVVLGRLSYCVFLVNLTVMIISQGSQRLPSYYLSKTWVDMWIYDSFKSYLMSVILYMVIEAPFGNLIRELFGRGKKKQLPKANEVQIEPIVIQMEVSK